MTDLTWQERRNFTVGWFHPGVLARPSNSIVSPEQRDKLHTIDRTARGLIVASLATAGSVAQIGDLRIMPHRDDDGSGTRGWRRIRITPETGQPDKHVVEAVRRTIGSVAGLNEVTYRAVTEDIAEADPYVQVVLDEAARAGFRDPIHLLAYAPVVAKYTSGSGGNPPEQRTLDMDNFEGAIALY